MDFFAHGLWSYIFFHKIKKPLYAVLFGLLPDVISWVPYFFYRILTGQETGRPIVELIPPWAFLLYNIGHSLIIAAFVLLMVYLVLRKVPLYLYAWPVSIVIDVLTHRREFLPTPFLWPWSDWKFPGISWGNPLFLVVNYSLIIICLTYILWKKGFFAKGGSKKRNRK